MSLVLKGAQSTSRRSQRHHLGPNPDKEKQRGKRRERERGEERDKKERGRERERKGNNLVCSAGRRRTTEREKVEFEKAE